MKIVVLDSCPMDLGDLDWKPLEKLGELKVYEKSNSDQILERLKDAEIVFTNKVHLDGNHFSKLPALRYIGVLATGFDIVDTAAAKDAGIVVTNIPAYGTQAVAQHAFALLLEITNRVGAYSELVVKGDWEKSGQWSLVNHPMMELAGKTMGIIGLGRIGRQTAAIAQAFGMKVLACDPYPNPALESESLTFVELETLLKRSDVIVLHCPLTAENYHLINHQTIAQMKDGVIIINNSRGALIEEHDLLKALNSGKVRAVGLDVLGQEPPIEDNPLFHLEGSYFTPHNSWAAFESRARLMNQAVRNLQAFLNGSPINVVNR